MNEIIYWLANNNTLMIQSGFTIVLLLSVVYIYRVFFVSDLDRSSESSKEIDELNKKITTLIQQQKTDLSKVNVQSFPTESTNVSTQVAESGGTVLASTSVAQTADISSQVQASVAETELLKAEVTRLKQQLNESEKKIFEMTPTVNTTNTSSANIVEASGEKAVVDELNKKILILETRLSEYDIISEDIAELSQLRAENTEMKKRLVAVPTSVNQEPAVAPVASPAPATSASTLLSVDSAIADSQITDIEKNLMSEFEKSTKKG